ncbi:MAG: putative AAA+ superfamily ATPase [Polaribacter sp.]|jgi:predicted AAA+ superfamily ATPase
MKRLLLNELLNWKQQENKKPILLDGARQVGKSYLLKELFGKGYFKNIHIIDFLKTPDAALLFEDDLEPDRIVDGINLFLKKKITPETDLIIFDEIGECPKAVQSLKFIAEDKPGWFVCASGSNIGLLDSFPVGKVHGLTLRPMNIEEFILALGSELEHSTFHKMDRREIVQKQLWSLLIDYFFVGGMPESVQSCLDTKEQSTSVRRKKVRQIQKDILQGYERDFGKYSGKVNALYF